jgi:hypothetical protein
VFVEFFLKHFGMGDTFLLNDIWTPDYYVGPGVTGYPAAPNLKAQLQLVEDTSTSTWYSPIQRKIGSAWYEDIADLNGSIVVYANGVLQTMGAFYDYTIGGPGLAIPGYSFAGKYIKWNHAPAPPITASFYFYWRTRYEEDQQDMEKFMYELWSAGGAYGGSSVKLMTVREYL